MATDPRKVEMLSGAREVLGSALDLYDRIKHNLNNGLLYDDATGRLSEARRLVVEATQKLSVAQTRVQQLLTDELEDTYTGWCGHRAKRETSLTCKCGPAPF